MVTWHCARVLERTGGQWTIGLQRTITWLLDQVNKRQARERLRQTIRAGTTFQHEVYHKKDSDKVPSASAAQISQFSVDWSASGRFMPMVARLLIGGWPANWPADHGPLCKRRCQHRRAVHLARQSLDFKLFIREHLHTKHKQLMIKDNGNFFTLIFDKCRGFRHCVCSLGVDAERSLGHVRRPI